MPTRRTLRIAHIAACLALVSANAVTTGGLIHDFPVDGAWSRFDVQKTEVEAGGQIRKSTGTLTLRAVGQATWRNIPCRWIEVETSLTMRRGNAPPVQLNSMYKVLIRKTSLPEDVNSGFSFVRVFKGKTADELKPIALNGSYYDLKDLYPILDGSLGDVEELPPAEVDAGGKKWTCRGFKAASWSASQIINTTTRLHGAAPFGVVTHRFEHIWRKEDGTVVSSETTDWTLSASGDGAASAAPGLE